MKVLDPFEVYEIEVWPLPQYEALPTSAAKAKAHLNWLELAVFKALLKKSHFRAVLNEKDPPEAPDNGYTLPSSWRGKVVSDDVFRIRNHPDTRIARRSETLSLLAKVISERAGTKRAATYAPHPSKAIGVACRAPTRCAGKPA
jgi:hypothetical protein